MQRRFLQTIAVPFQRTTQLRVSSFHSASIIASSKSSKSSTRDTRLAGRLRFYKQVGVAPVAAPWEDKKKNDETTLPSIESPISAGVDGSASASGVHHLKKKTSKSKDALQWMLSPRRPGSNTSMDCKWFGITLDGRSLSTPMGQTLAVPSERLAYAIAAEWDAQAKYLQPANMPFMTLACTTLDQAAHHPDFYRDQSLNFLPTDTVRTSIVNGDVILMNWIGLDNPCSPSLFVLFAIDIYAGRLVFGRIPQKIASCIVVKNKPGKTCTILLKNGSITLPPMPWEPPKAC
jgi:hypothetical protein